MTVTTRYRGGATPVASDLDAAIARARAPRVPSRGSPTPSPANPGLQTGFDEPASTVKRRDRKPRRFSGLLERSLSDAEVTRLTHRSGPEVLAAVADKRLTVEQVSRLLRVFVEPRGLMAPASDVSSELNRFQALEFLALHTDATGEELAAVSDAFSAGAKRDVERVLERIPPPSKRRAVFEPGFAKLVAQVFGPSSEDDSQEALRRHSNGRTFHSIQLRVLTVHGRLSALERLQDLWSRWRGGDGELVLSGRWPLRDVTEARPLFKSAPSAEERERLKEPAHLAQRAALLERRPDDRYHRELLIPEDGRLLSGLQIWDLVRLSSTRVATALETLVSCWDGTGDPLVLVAAVDADSRKRDELLAAFWARQEQLARAE